jgi:hypothetical protein
MAPEVTLIREAQFQHHVADPVPSFEQDARLGDPREHDEFVRRDPLARTAIGSPPSRS